MCCDPHQPAPQTATPSFAPRMAISLAVARRRYRGFGSPPTRPFGSPPSRPFGSPPTRPFGSPPTRPFGSPPTRPFGSPPTRPFGSPPTRWLSRHLTSQHSSHGPARRTLPVSATLVKAAIHPGIGIARLGDSADGFFIGNEVRFPCRVPPNWYKDASGALKRQAARFRV